MATISVQDYIASKPLDAQTRLNELRSYLLEAAPGAGDELKWGKPALVHEGILFVYAAAKNHISLHPTPSVVSHFQQELGARVASQNTIHFAMHEPIPKALVVKLAAHRVYEKDTLGVKWK